MKKRPAGKTAVLLEKIDHFWSYHKWLLLTALFLSCLGIYGVRMALTQKEAALSGAFINCHALTESALSEQFAAYAQIDLRNSDVRLDDDIFLSMDYTPASMAALESVFARIYAGELDFLAADTDIFQRCGANPAALRYFGQAALLGDRQQCGAPGNGRAVYRFPVELTEACNCREAQRKAAAMPVSFCGKEYPFHSISDVAAAFLPVRTHM